MCSHSRLYHISLTLYGSTKNKCSKACIAWGNIPHILLCREMLIIAILKVVMVFYIVNCSKST